MESFIDEIEPNLLIIDDRKGNYMHVHFWPGKIIVRYWDKPFTVTKKAVNIEGEKVIVKEFS